MASPLRLLPGDEQPQSVAERDLLVAYRESMQDDRTMLYGLLRCWPKLSTAHRGLVFRIADALYSAAKWRHMDPVPEEQTEESRRLAILMADEARRGRT